MQSTKHAFRNANIVRLGDVIKDTYVVAWWVDGWVAMPVIDEPIGAYCVDIEIEPGQIQWVVCNLITTISQDKRPWWSFSMREPVPESELDKIQGALRALLSGDASNHIAPRVDDPEYGGLLQGDLAIELLENWGVSP